jgi:hypothetical protein
MHRIIPRLFDAEGTDWPVCRNYMKVRSNFVEPHLRDWETTALDSGLQTDGVSCGVFIAMVSFMTVNEVTLQCYSYYIVVNRKLRVTKQKR